MKSSPHDNVCCRLRPSPIHGVGVFAIRDIPTGMNLFCDDDDETFIVTLHKKEIENLEPEIKRLYNDFCVITGDEYECPKSFNQMTVAWYINESKDNPNVKCDDGLNFIAVRDIASGEEILVDYSTYSDYPEEETES